MMTQKKNILLWLDDRRDPFKRDWQVWLCKYGPLAPPYEIIWVITYMEFVDWIKANGLPAGICFDNDLGDFSGPDGSELRGIDCCKWLVEYCLDSNVEMPLHAIQSSNTNAREFIDGTFKSFKNRQR